MPAMVRSEFALALNQVCSERGINPDVVLEVSPSRIYQRDGDDLYINQELDFIMAITGGEMEVPTPKGNLKIKIHSGTQPNTMIRLANRGVPHINRTTSGDLYVRLKVKIPTKITAQQKELLHEFAGQKSSGFSWF
jgi:molecular chaperone DnaJ